jgi:hypothetical protein
MRCAAPLQLSVRRYDLWRAAAALLATSACAAMLAWWWAQPVPAPRWASATAATAALLSLACLAGLWRMHALTLRWDRERWLVGWDGADERPGELAVAIDLGGWMLLRFVPAGTGAGPARYRRALWIALQRCGLEAQWHALRCAVYMARPAPLTAPETDPA